MPRTPSLRLACAAAVAEAGAEVWLSARSAAEVQAAAAALRERGDRAHALVLKVTDSAAVSSAAAAHGPFQVLVNNAGTNCPKPFDEVSVDDVDALLGLNAKAAFFVAPPHGIRVNTVGPSFIDTPLTHDWLAAPAFRDQVLGKMALGRVGRVEDVIGAVLFLAGDAAALVTGSALMVDGGWTAA